LGTSISEILTRGGFIVAKTTEILVPRERLVSVPRGIFYDILKKTLEAEKLVYCYECGTCTASCPVVKIIPEFNPRTFFQRVLLNQKNVLAGVDLWLCARCYQCYKRCPHKVNLPDLFCSAREVAVEQGLTDAGKLTEALKLLREKIPFPVVYGWLCLRPCEGRSVLDNMVVAALQRFIIDYEKEKTVPVPNTREEKIAIIGSGPAGLTAAYDLVRNGYPVTVFEALPEAGGILRAGIRKCPLPSEVLDNEIQYLKDLGVEIRTKTSVGEDVTFNDLLGEYKAILIAVGAHKTKKPIAWSIFEWVTAVESIQLPKAVKTIGKTIAVDPATLETCLAGVFAAGDAVSGPSNIPEAVAAGKRAAVSMLRYLGETQIE
jgi:NADPH-dependent glutamate synthase beta subunit-like oxidoreductase